MSIGLAERLLLAGILLVAGWNLARVLREALYHPTALERRSKQGLARMRRRAGLPPARETLEVTYTRRRATRLAWWAVVWRCVAVVGVIAGVGGGFIGVWLGVALATGVSTAFWLASAYTRRTRIRWMRQVAPLLQVFLADVDQPRHGYELVRIFDWPGSKTFELLAELEGVGWLTPLWETAEPSAATSDPSWRRYRLRADSAAAARHELATVTTQ